MDVFLILFLSSVSVLFGIILTLVLQYYVLVRYFNKSPIASAPKKCSGEAYSLPEALKKELENNDFCEKSEGSSLPISLMLQFLFHELRHSDRIKRWLYKKLSIEFDELLNKTTIGKFFEAVTIRDMHLGTQFPDIKSVKVEDLKLDKKDGYIETLNLSINLDYTGNFLLSVDGKMKFGKTAYLSIKVKRVSGVARLQFTRIPYTHWSFSFYNEPIMELAVESHFQGRQLQSNITNLIVNQIKKAIKRKHTLPNYKIRYKPFFVKTDPGQLDFEDSEIYPQGQLEVTCMEATRLAATTDIPMVYCTLTIDTIPFVCVYRKDGINYAVIELTMTKVRQQQLGVIFKQEQLAVIVDSVTPQTPASRAGLKSGDVLIAVENKVVTNVTQLSKLIKSISAINFSLRVERVAQNYVFKMKSCDKTDEKTSVFNVNSIDDEVEQDSFIIIDNIKQSPEEYLDVVKKTKSITNLDKIKSSEKVPKIISSSNENMSKFAQTLGNFTLRKRKPSSERLSTGDNSNKSTPTASGPGTPQHLAAKHSITVPTSILYAKKHSISEVPETMRMEMENIEADPTIVSTEIFKGQEINFGSVMTFNDEHVFNLKNSSKYLNVNIWGVSPNAKDVLLGYVNIPLTEILNECCNSMLGHYTRSYSFLPPNATPPNSQTHPLMSHSGFEHVFCYGDVLLSFLWFHDDIMEIKSKSVESPYDPDQKPIDIPNKHDFIRTQFHRTTHCDFCSKKIWLKDAVQCRECGLCCHKKCISKCQLSTECLPADRSNLKADVSDIVQPEIIMTEVCDDTGMPDAKIGISSLKRVNSANNLTIPGQSVLPNQTRSLPPSPQRTPSRKQSLATANPFTLCATALEEVQKQPDDASDCVARLLDHVMSCATDESLMDVAKESGKQLYAQMPNDAKIEKINLMMSFLKKTFDIVTTEHTDLNKKMNSEESEVEKTKIAFLMGQADAKLHGLSVLMLHYCSGLQQTQEKIV